MKSNLIILICIGIVSIFSACKTPSQGTEGTTQDSLGEIHRVGVEEFKQKLGENSAQLVDVRTPGEFEAGYIDGAINYNINGAAFQQQVESLDKNKPVLLYCKMGGRSARAAKLLQELGFSNIYDLEGGYTAWSASQ